MDIRLVMWALISILVAINSAEDEEEKLLDSELLNACGCDGLMCNCCVPVLVPVDELGCVRFVINPLALTLNVTMLVGPVVLYNEIKDLSSLPEFCIPFTIIQDAKICIEAHDISVTPELTLSICGKVKLRLNNKVDVVYEPNCLHIEVPGLTDIIG